MFSPIVSLDETFSGFDHVIGIWRWQRLSEPMAIAVADNVSRQIVAHQKYDCAT
jgi:hypothetical protein